MVIDWFTVGAQVLNFIVLIWLLKHFLYKPILSAIDGRQKRIAEEQADAAKKVEDAERVRAEFRDKSAAIEQRRVGLLAEAATAASVEQKRLLDEVRNKADALSARLQQTIHDEARSLNEAIVRRTQQEVMLLTRRALAELAATSLEQRVTELFVQRIHELSGEAKIRLGQALSTSTQPALVRSAFELAPAQRLALQTALNETFSADIALCFESQPALIVGIELSANGQRLDWNFGSYLTSLEASVALLANRELDGQRT
ncbi:MAG: H+-transporting two-sector ATPase, subunit [Myxococcaceae bacterium]|nr:H+-transporting two-sector ATPase, subunit [Myxococcaceae bacterium]